MYDQNHRPARTRMSHYLRTGQKIGGFRPDSYKSYDLCDLCGGAVYDLDIKSIRSERNSRYRALFEAYQAAKRAGKTDKFTREVKPRLGGPDRPHTAIDIRNFLGHLVYAVLPGKVVKISSDPRSGNYIKIKHKDGLESSYSHTKSNVKEGETVVAGQVIGHSDGSGTSDGRGGLAPHLHFVLRKNGVRINPLTILKKPAQTE